MSYDYHLFPLLLFCCQWLQFQIQTMLSTIAINSLRNLGIQAVRSEDFVSGLKLMQLVCQVFYQGEDKVLASKLRLSQSQKTGNNVLNINIILTHLKKDPTIDLPQQIRTLTAFKLIQEEDTMIQLIEWLLSHSSKNRQPSRLNEEMSPPRQQENQFENLYFVASLKKHEDVLNDSLDEESPRDKVVRKGSFKVLKPKLSTASKQSIDQNASFSGENKTENSVQKQPLRQRKRIDQNIMQTDDKDDLQCRKTIPKMSERPPLYKSKQKEQKTQPKQADKKDSPSEITKRLTSQDQLLQHIQYINKKIIQEQKSLSLNAEDPQVEKRSRKSSRKIFKIDIPEVQESKKKLMVEWLIAINLLNSSSTKYFQQLHSICKDGVVFIEIMNYYKGRGKEVCYFKEPKRAAELNSNYQKLFAFLNEQIQFKSELLHQYEYFIPEAQPNAFWSLLASIHQCFNKRVQPRQKSINRYENSISKKIERETSKKKSTNDSASYSQIKYNSASLKKEVKNNYSSAELPRRQTPKRITEINEQLAEKSIVPSDLVQIQQPQEEASNQRTERGYKQMYLCKFKNIQTPQKNRSFQNTSLSRSRLKLSVGSSKKKEVKPAIPSISLEMQMKVLQYLQTINIQGQNHELFKDPYRNGVLICAVIKKSLAIDPTISHRPKSIQDCRNNFISAIDTLKSYKQNFNTNYEHLVEDLVRGERALLYGLIWQAIKEEEKQCKNFEVSLDLNPKGQNEQYFVSWVRTVQRSCPDLGAYRIRSQQSLFHAIASSDFLFRYSWFITGKKAVTPTFEKPINEIQKESNLKKSIGYLVQNKIVRSDYLWKTRSLVKGDQAILSDLITQLINHYNHLQKKEQTKTVNFVKYLRREGSQSREKVFEKLDTTMVNQTIPQQQKEHDSPKVEIPWMRKLGFTGPLELNNGVVLCCLLSKLTMKTIEGVHENPQSRAECLGNLRKAIRQIPKCKWNEYDIFEGDAQRNLEVYSLIKERFRHAYAMKGI